jgi:hypothetical protein
MGNATLTTVANRQYPGGSVYSGQMYGSSRQGQGALAWPDGASYAGSWNNDKCEGHGTMRFPNGSMYEGNFVRNNPSGQGKLTTINQEVLDGNWEFYGRSGQTSTPVGKYQFRGMLIDLATGEKRMIDGPLALYMLSGLVSLPNMPDPSKAMLPFAEVVGKVDDESNGKMDKYDKYDEAAVPVASAVPLQVANAVPLQVANAPSSISYGNHEPAFRERHPDDHGVANLLDPRLYLANLGVPVQPENLNAARQAQIRAEAAQYDAQFRHG